MEMMMFCKFRSSLPFLWLLYVLQGGREALTAIYPGIEGRYN
jgi:flagellar biosynthesis protein FliP